MACLPNYLELARVLQGRLHDLEAGGSSTELRQVLEIAAEEFGIQGDEHVHNNKRRQRLPILRAAQSHCLHSCDEHKEVMDPGLWGTLHHDMLQLIFSYLPVNDICSLRFLSKFWKNTLTGDSSFLRICNQEHSKMFALVRKARLCRSGPENLFLLRVFDTTSNTWHALQLSFGDPKTGYGHLLPRYRNVTGGDGGLLLVELQAHDRGIFSELWKKGRFCSLFFTVVNPLTGNSRDLPPVANVTDVTMRHMMVNRETSSFKVLIVVNRSGEGEAYRTNDVQVFDSETGEWSLPHEAADVMFGDRSAHDFAMGRLLEQHVGNWCPERYSEYYVESLTFLGDRLFVLRKGTDGPASQVPTNRSLPTYYIREYAIEYHPRHRPTLGDVEIHRCGPFEHISKGNNHKLTLLASNGFLVVLDQVVFSATNELEPFRSERGWIYNLATRTWHDLPGDTMWMHSDSICEIRWNAHP